MALMTPKFFQNIFVDLALKVLRNVFQQPFSCDTGITIGGITKDILI